MSGQAGEGGFLGRWSRRKRQAEADVTSAETPPVEDAATVPPVPAMDTPDPVDVATIPADAPAESAEEDPYVRFRLPRLEDLTANSDIALFMQRGVPEAIRTAALRKMWALVPAIRDFRTPAEYDLDWNTPGGAPGYGPLTESDNVAEMVERLLGHRKSPEERARESAQAAQDAAAVSPDPILDAPVPVADTAQHPADDTAAPQQDMGPAPAPPTRSVRLTSRETVTLEADGDPEVPTQRASGESVQREVGAVPMAPVRRRHGGAAPV